MPTDADLTRVLGMIREAIERTFDMTLPSATTMNGQVEAIVQAIYDVAADRARPATTPATDEKTRSTFQYRIDLWDGAGDNIVEHGGPRRFCCRASGVRPCVQAVAKEGHYAAARYTGRRNH